MTARKNNGLPVRAQPAELRFLSSASLRCPNCHGTDLKKVSLAYQEGLFSIATHTRLRGLLLGGPGPNLIIGKATTRGFHQSALSKRLKPPVKWSFRKLIRWWAVLFVSICWLISYTMGVTKNSSVILSPPVILFSSFSAVTFLVLVVLFWSHNQFAYKRQYSQWERSFLCQRCGTLREQE